MGLGINDFTVLENLKGLLEVFQRIQTSASANTKILEYYHSLIVQSHLYLGNYDAAWSFMKTGISLRVAYDVQCVKSRCRDKSIDGDVLILIAGRSNALTKIGKDHIERIVSLVNIFLEDFHKIHGRNYIDYLCGDYDYANLSPTELEEFRQFYPDQENYNFWLKDYYSPGPKPYLYPTTKRYLWGDRYIEYREIPYVIEVAVINEAKRLIREAENTVREEMDIPRVGEGWKNEAILLRRILDAFPNEKIIHHGKPSWLRPQHLDIYFPNRAIGIEYQGEQHQKAHFFWWGRGF